MTPRETELAELRQRIVAIEAAIASLDKEFATLGGAFHRGDQAAIKKATAIQQRINELRCDKALALSAQKKTIQQQRHEQAEAEQAARRERTVEAARHADAIAALEVRIDEALRSLAGLFAERSNALQALASTGVIDPAFINRLQSNESVTAAACHVNLHKFIALETVAPQSHQPLAGANSGPLGIGKDADDFINLCGAVCDGSPPTFFH
jgi:DNA repair exonuclease SbcCD ATPase subunit